MISFDKLDDQQYNSLIEPVWEFLAITDRIAGRYDCIFVFGGTDLSVPLHASRLWKQGAAPILLVTGGHGSLNEDQAGSEAAVFSNFLIESGVDPGAIVIETKASNSGENVEYGLAKLTKQGIPVRRVIAVAKPFIMRRCVLTFAKLAPTITVTPSPPPGNALAFLDRDRRDYAGRLAAELDRLQEYPALGYIEAIKIPAEVINSAAQIRLATNR
ncbi:YdcF family protein [Mycobacteroides abscessus]|uniref:YdcF family protein n=1 Tax=Mycobacteroides abscessus TaxID=36809 RepID=UPI00266F148F|nr:YdcF family protein [Mycobacteroides abscessus]MDO3109825.1 YdcF family protein [Mycobacteroides abscessus subsp. abscessus]